MAAERTFVWDSKVAIIGAGISGLAAAKQLAGHKPVVFEASDSIGGVWKHCSYGSTRLQTPRRDYEFSDFPWPESGDDTIFPTHTEILEYLNGYATHFDVLKFVQLNCKVVEVQCLAEQVIHPYSGQEWDLGTLPAGRPIWKIGVKRTGSDNIEVEINDSTYIFRI